MQSWRVLFLFFGEIDEVEELEKLERKECCGHVKRSPWESLTAYTYVTICASNETDASEQLGVVEMIDKDLLAIDRFKQLGTALLGS